MPLGRFGIRNEYGLGSKELYKASVETEDPKAVLDGVAVAGLVGLLRQLGDLSQFAAEVFHGLQEQLASTGSRSRKLVNRIQHVEASLPSLEKAMLSQTSHIHFAYQPGSNWHPRIKKEQNHFISNDLPHFIMDSYEECREPPRLQLLDRFDNCGSGSCLKRYTDPTFFRKASTSSEARNREKSQQERKARKFKRKRSRQLSGRLPNSVHNVDNSGRAPISSQTGRGESSLSHTSSTLDRAFTSDMRDQSDSRNSKESVGFVGLLPHPSISIQPDQMKSTEFVSNMDEIMEQTSPKSHLTDRTSTSRKDCQAGSSTDDTAPRFSNVTWHEKLEIMEHLGVNTENEDSGHLSPETINYLHEQDVNPVGVKSINEVDDLSEHGGILKSNIDQHYIDAVANAKLNEPTGLHYQYKQDMTPVDADEHHEDDLSELGSSPESNITSLSQEEGLSEQGSIAESDSDGKKTTTVLNWDMELTRKDSVIDEFQDVDKSTFDLHEHDFVHVNLESYPQLPSTSKVENDSREQRVVVATPESFSQLTRFDKGENSQNSITNGNFVNDRFDSKLSIGDIQYMLETIDNSNWAMKTVDANQGGISSPQVENLSKVENCRGSLTDGNSDGKLAVGDFQYMLETNLDNATLEPEIISDEYGGLVETFTKGANDGNVIEWHNDDDIDSETDNFVDALYTIDSESESDVETYTRKEVQPLSCICYRDESASTDLMADKVNHSETENDFHSRFYDQEDGANDGSEEPTATISLDNLECLESLVSPEFSESAIGHEQDAVSYASNEQSRESASPYLEKTHGIDVCDNGDEINLEPAIHKPVESSSLVSGANDGSEDPTATLPLDNLECLESPVAPEFSESANGHEQDAVSHSSHEHSRESASSFLEKTHGIDVCDNGDEINLEPAVHKPVESSSLVSGANDGSEDPTATLPLDNLECLESPVSPEFSESANGHEQDAVSPSSHEHSRESASSFLEKTHGIDVCDNGDEINLEPAVHKPVESSSLVSGANDGSEDPTATLPLDNLECLESPVSPEFFESANGHEQDAVSHSSHEQSTESASSFSEKTHGIDVCDNGDEINLESAAHKPVESSCQVSCQDETSCTPHVSGQTSFGSTISYPPAFWSNGTLFGLQPSKPTVVSMSNPVDAAPVSSGNGNVADQCNPRVNDPAGALSSSVENSYHDDNLGHGSQDVKSLNQISKGVLDRKNDKSLHDDKVIINNDAVARYQGNDHVTSHKITVPAGPVSKNVFGEVTNTGEDRPSILSLLAQNLLKNGLRRSGSWGYDDKSKPNNPVATNVFDNRSSVAVSDTVLQTNLNNGKMESPVNSPPPSPPLEHMKISFRPLGGFETSRLKLKYPEGINDNEMTIETFPSFQLVPESTRLHHDMGSDSDDDTFCQSYPCISDYSMSHRSDSDSDQWETGDTSDSNDHELNSACSSSHFDDIDSRIYSMSGPKSQLPTLGTANKFSYEEMKVCLNPEADSSHLPDLTSQPPPLPPLQWHISKRLSHVIEEKPEHGSKSLNQSFDSEVLESAIPHSTQDLDVAAKPEKVAEPKVDDQKQSYHGDNGRIIDEQGDFLHQIRTKSFNLKRADAARSCGMPSLASNNKVTAILQKANAIRQAVGSEGEDDSWSDT